MLTQALTATFAIFSDEPIPNLVIIAPRAEELPEIASASRNHTSIEEPIESRLFMWMDH